jgi:hypothetical protein
MPIRLRFRAVAASFIAGTAFIAATSSAAWSAPTCPLSYGATDSAKSHKLFLYFPTTADATFPAYATGVSPAARFDVADLNPVIGTTNSLRSRIFDVVSDDYCEFNVQVLSTTTNPATLASPPARRVTVAIGSDSTSSGAWGQAQEVDTGDVIDIDFARVWAGEYTACEGGNGGTGCSMTGSLTGANATLDRWAQAIGGTAAHEAGHTYGLAHTNDDSAADPCGQAGPGPLAGEDSLHRHLMPAGCNLTGNDRATYRRHFSDITFGLLARDVGLSIQTMHNWDLVNPNAAAGHSLRIDFLSPLPAVNVAWTWTGSSSAWISPAVSGPSGTSVFKGTTYNRYRITWSVGNPAWTTAAPGVVPGGAEFHIGATFTGVDFNQPDPIIIQNVTLLDGSSNPLTLHPRLPMYDTGAVDSADGTFGVHFFAPPAAPEMFLQNAVIYQLPRVASIQSMTGSGRPVTFDKVPIRPWSVTKCHIASLREAGRCVIAKITARPHVLVTHKLGTKGVYDCSHGVPKVKPPVADSQDRPKPLDYEGPICAGTQRDPFPSATVYVIATFIDPKAKHYDRNKKAYVTGPVKSKVYYQFAGLRDLRRLKRHFLVAGGSGGFGLLQLLPILAAGFVALLLTAGLMRARRLSQAQIQGTV